MAEAEARIKEVLESGGTELYLSRLGLKQLPESIGRLTQIKSLHLDNNQLTQLPKSIGNLIQLRTLFLHNNPLTQLPESIGNLSQLRILFILNSQLTQLPESIGNLTQLERFFLRDNQLTKLPDSIRNLSQLERLYLHGNAALGLPREVLGPDIRESEKAAKPADILNYYFRIRAGKRPLNEAKLILVGRGAVGKTSLVNRIVHGKFDKDEKKTDGIKITDWDFQLNGDEDIRLNIWDFGGQEIMHATHQFFLTQRSLYLLVINGREGGEDADAEYWLKLISSFGGDSPVIVVMNKIKDHAFDLNRRALESKYPIREFIKTDCEENIGIDELIKAIKRETDRLEHLRDAFPTSWFEIKDKLSGMKDNFLSFTDYCKICEDFGEKDEAAQTALAGHLHNLGIALNYDDDPRLQDTHVLNPHWVTDGIYKVLNSELLEKQKGAICLSDLSSILDKKDYPANMRLFLFDLMKKFDLCFSYHGDENRYLIPELLGKQEAEETREFEVKDCLNFQYHYPILPEGLLPRFIVRSHTMSEGLSRWRTGVILSFEGCKALVKADPQDKKVFISVSGPVANRRRLLAVIRSDFERIHSDIKNLKPQEMVPLPEYPHVVLPYKKLMVMEEKNVEAFQEVVDDDVVEIKVQALLNGVDLEGARSKQSKRYDESSKSLKLFYSYSHKDEEYRGELETHLKLMQRQSLIDTWHDRKIMPGENWKGKIDDNLERADIILLLVSADFIASDYCYDLEMGRALERENNGEAKVIPVIVRDVNWDNAPFARLQALPKDGKAVKLWKDKDTAWRNVSEGIEELVEEMLSAKNKGDKT